MCQFRETGFVQQIGGIGGVHVTESGKAGLGRGETVTFDQGGVRGLSRGGQSPHVGAR